MRTGAHVKHLAVVFKLSSSFLGVWGAISAFISMGLGSDWDAIPKFTELNWNEKVFSSLLTGFSGPGADVPGNLNRKSWACWQK